MSTLPTSILEAKKLRRALLQWYDAHKRDLPWRQTADPYRVWVSEIMLQQTRVAVVTDYYRRFLRRFPTLTALARAPEAEVMALWSGLGYYRRARLMHRAARLLTSELAGRWPQNAAALRALPGIGRYTASAIASICFNEKTAVVDGNVERILGRLSGGELSLSQQWATANALVSPQRPGDFNQAMMELGATVCTPLAPRCDGCPVRKHCIQRGRLRATTPPPVKRERAVHYALDVRDQAVRLVQRSARESLMPSMWELPRTRSKAGPPDLRLQHTITNTHYRVSIYRERARGGRYFPIPAAWQLPLTGLTRKVLRAAGLE